MVSCLSYKLSSEQSVPLSQFQKYDLHTVKGTRNQGSEDVIWEPAVAPVDGQVNSHNTRKTEHLLRLAIQAPCDLLSWAYLIPSSVLSSNTVSVLYLLTGWVKTLRCTDSPGSLR